MFPAPQKLGFVPPLTELHIIALSGFLITFGALVLLNALRRASFRADAACRLSLASALPKRLVRALPLVLTSCGFVEVLLLAGWAVTAALYLKKSESLANKYNKIAYPGRAIGSLLAPSLGVALLPVARTSVFSLLAGVSFERAIVFHQAAIAAFYALLVAHVAAITATVNKERSLYFIYTCTDECSFGAGNGDLSGTISATLFVALAILALLPVRAVFWELFKLSHITLWPTAFALSVLHARMMFPYVIIPAGLWALDWAIRWVMSAFPQPATVSVLDNGTVVKIVTEGGGWRGRARPGAHAYICASGRGFHGPLAYGYWHPLSIADEDPSTGALTFLARVQRGAGAGGCARASSLSWTAALAALASSPADVAPAQLAACGSRPSRRVWLRVDGPYNGGCGLNLGRYNQVVLVAGGAGVAPLAAAAAALIRSEKEDDASSLDPSPDSGCVSRLARLRRIGAGEAVDPAVAANRGAFFLWSLRAPPRDHSRSDGGGSNDSTPGDWLPGFLPKLRASPLFGPDRVRVAVTGGNGSSSGSSGGSGGGGGARIDVAAAVDEAVAAAAAAGHSPSRVAVLVCGPARLVSAAVTAAAAVGAHAHVVGAGGGGGGSGGGGAGCGGGCEEGNVSGERAV